MTYGDGKRAYADRDYGPVNVIGFGLASALGIAAAVIVDLVQQREASALYVINRWVIEVTSMLGISSVPLYGVMLLLMAIGAISVVFTQPTTLRGAFAQGFGALAVLVTVAPADLGAPLEAPAEETRSPEMMNFDEAFAEPARIGGAQLVPVAVQRQGQYYQLRIKIDFPNGLKQDIDEMIRRNRLVGKLWNPETGKRYNIFRTSGAEIDYDESDGTLRIITKVAAADEEAELWILIEAEGYRITEERFVAKVGPNPIWTVDMQPSTTPLLVQRLRHSYRF
ncbi:hypothetical protein [Parvularcula lutaonensis]|uniref:Uncharacterized protein n=1 Tax=Parvularcula lutaonensis TaxID=491923 RepID=A0ABV7ME63_9PROT|nr:hypothetical protein [Parvularcula lutaonensis]GGY51054.1 hypothetical protein GCM10007148_19880 [Parvularcula lutaonensis]